MSIALDDLLRQRLANRNALLLSRVRSAFVGRFDPENPVESLQALSVSVGQATAQAQAQAMGEVGSYLRALVSRGGDPAGVDPFTLPTDLIGRAANGSSVISVTGRAASSYDRRIRAGWPQDRASASAQAWLTRVAASEPSRAANTALVAAARDDPRLTGRYLRNTRAEACDFCAEIASRGYTEAAAGFEAHGNCRCLPSPEVAFHHHERGYRVPPAAAPAEVIPGVTDPTILSDAELEDQMTKLISDPAFGTDPRTEAWLDELTDEMDIRQAREQAVIDERERKARNAAAHRDRQREAQASAIGDLIGQGVPETEAIAEVTGRPFHRVQQDMAADRLRSAGYSGTGFDQLARDAFREHQRIAMRAAEDHMRGGHELNLAGRAQRVNADQLWTGPETFARKWASPELLEFWDANGRTTYAAYREHLLTGSPLRDLQMGTWLR